MSSKKSNITVSFAALLRAIFVSISAAVPALVPAPVLAQCDDWIQTPGLHAPFRAVGGHALTTYTPPGATVPRVIVGAQDLYLNGIDIQGIAQWDGTSWSPLGAGLNATVMDALVWNSPTGQFLIASGNFSNAGGQPANYIAAWNGTSWSQIGGGVHQASGGWVAAMTVWDPDGTGPQPPNLVVAGDFDRAGTVDCQNIARWDGTTWRTFGIGLNNWVDALTTWDPDGPGPTFPHLVAAGHFTVANNTIVNHIALWDGFGWRRMGDGLSIDSPFAATADALTTWDSDGPGPLNAELIVVGSFSHADTTQAHGIAAWNGTSWRSFNTPEFTSPSGVGTWDPDAAGPQFPQLVVSGNVIDGAQNRIDTPAMWNGSTFQTLGNFADTRWAERFVTWDPDNAGPSAPRLVASGLIYGNLPSGAGQGVIQLVNNEWTTFGAPPNILAAATLGNRIIVGGQFHMMAANPADPFFPLDAANIAAWDGYEVSSFGNVSGTVRALKSFTNNTTFPAQRDLFVAGTFGGVASPGAVGFTVNNIARYSENSRDRGGGILPPGWFTMGDGFNSSVHALERFNNATYAGGSFTASGATAANRVARYDGTNWQPLGTGMNTGTVHALRVYNGALYAGGNFTAAGGVTTGGLARWNGSAWSAVSGVFSGVVYALAVHNNELIIGGQFGVASNIIKYNGTAFSAIGAGGTNAAVRSLTVGPDGLLYIGGDFTSVSAVPADHIARWNGSAWGEIRGGLNGPVQALQTFRNEVHAGGTFGKARSGQFIAPAWGRYTVDGIPWIARQPDSTQVCVGDDAGLYAYLAPGYFPLTFQWRHNGVPIELGQRPWGSVVESAHFGLRIANAKPQDSGSYDYVATHTGCGSVTSALGTILVCGADFNCDGAVDLFDYLDFVAVFSTQSPAADYNSDGVVDFFDYLDFVDAFSTGC